MNDGFIYSLSDPRNGEIRYVGYTGKSLELRLSRHIKNATSGKKSWLYNWIRVLLSDGHTPNIDILEKVKQNHQEREKYWIRVGKEKGWNLTNATIGGDGVVGYAFTEEVKEKISEKIRNMWSDPSMREKIINSRIGLKHTEETKRKMSASMTGLKRSSSGRENIRKAELGRVIPEEQRQKISATLKGRVFSNDTCKKISLSLKGNKNGQGKHPSEETRKKLRDAWTLRKAGVKIERPRSHHVKTITN
jgi:hypothetical protein